MHKIYFFLALFCGLFATAQQLNCKVTVNFDKINNANNQTFKTLETSITEFLNRTDWTGDAYGENEKVDCAMFITLNSFDNNQYSATIQVQSSRPIFNSSYSSPVFNFNDNDFNFTYVEFERLNFNPSSFDSNLVSVLSFYSFIILALDADTFSPKGGESWLEMAQEVSSVAQQGGYKGWSQADGNQTRYFLINDLMSSTFTAYRTAMYQYHYEGLDIMANDLKAAKQKVASSLTTLADLYSVRPNAFLTRVFFDAKSDEIVSIFSGGPSIPVADLVDNLNRISPLNSSKWGGIRL